MWCITEPELADHEILAYLDGEGDPAVLAHMARCVYCQGRAEKLAHLQDQLSERLHRALCPSSMELGEFYLGTLAEQPSASISRHLASCPHCQRELTQLQEFMTLPPEISRAPWLSRTRDQVRTLVAQLIGPHADTPSSALVPSYRGSADAEAAPSMYEAEDVQIVIKCQPGLEREGQWDCIGLVTGLEAPGEFEAQLWRTGELVATASLDEMGNLTLDNLFPSEYTLVIAGRDVEIRIESCIIGPRWGTERTSGNP